MKKRREDNCIYFYQKIGSIKEKKNEIKGKTYLVDENKETNLISNIHSSQITKLIRNPKEMTIKSMLTIL